MPKKNTTAITFRCDVSVADMLDEICRLSGMKRGEFLISVITSQYDKINGNPQLKHMLDQMREIADTMKQMTGYSDQSPDQLSSMANGGEV